MLLAWYFIDIWHKPQLYLTPLDELALAAEIIVVFGVLAAAGFVWTAALGARREDHADGPLPPKAGRQRWAKPPRREFRPVPTPAPPPDKPSERTR